MKKETMTPDNPRWQEFYKRMSGPEGCDFSEKGKWTWKCVGGMDRPAARKILKLMGFDVTKSLEYFEKNGGYCDCEILFSVDKREEDEALMEL